MFIDRRKNKYFSLLPIIIVSMLLFKLISHPEILPNILKYFLSIFSYIIWAFAIAFILNPLMVFLETRLKLNRLASLLIIYLSFLAVVILVAVFIAPVLFSNIIQLGSSLPDFVTKTQNLVLENIKGLKIDDSYNLTSYLESNLPGILTSIQNYLGFSLKFLYDQFMAITTIIIKFILGLLISIYMLSDKEKVARNTKRFLFALFKQSTVEMLIKIGTRINNSFSRYLTGKFICAAIIGFLCFVGFLIFNIPFALLLSILVGVTNLIPYIGGFIGMIPSVIIVFLADPVKALWALIVLLILQQLDSWVLSPKIIGDQTGLSPLFVIIALMVGGATFGILGMFLAIPLFAVLKQFLEEFTEGRLKKKNMDSSNSEIDKLTD